MSFQTYEQYDENEYFIKFLRIHPHLSYADSPYNKKKLEFQISLLNKLNDKIINIEQFKSLYTKLIEKEKENYIKIEDLKFYYQNIVNELKNETNNEIINFIDNIM